MYQIEGTDGMYYICSDAWKWKILGLPVVIGGDNLPSPGWNTDDMKIREKIFNRHITFTAL